MATETADKNELLTATGDAVSEIIALESSIDESKFNAVPYQDSWTPGQLGRHVAKVISGIAMAMGTNGKPAQRDPGERIPELKNIFLDFSRKMTSPDFVRPEDGPYEKQAVTEELKGSVEQLKQSAGKSSLTDFIENPALGELSKLEALHFVVYHTQRHLHQMNKIAEALHAQ